MSSNNIKINSNAFTPNKNLFLELFFGILGLIFIILVIIIIVFYFQKKNRNVKQIKPSYSYGIVSDTKPHTAIDNEQLIRPQDELKYSFSFFLQISDFYSNRGYWKCIMIKGSEFPSNKKGTLCVDSLPNIKRFTASDRENCIKEKESIYDCSNSINTDKCKILKNKLDDNDKQIELNSNNPSIDLNERLDVICRSLELGEQGKNMLCDLASRCSLFKKDEKTYNIREGICQRFLDRHKDYCNNVYAIDKKVERAKEEERIRELLKSGELTMNENKTLQDYIDLKNQVAVRKRYLDYDNIENAQHFLNEYPELLPKNLEELNENDLINHSLQNSLNNEHSVKTPIDLEGCYDFNISKSLKNLTTNNSSIEYSKNIEKVNINGQQVSGFINSSTELSEINKEAEENGYEYFGVEFISKDQTNSAYKAYFFSEIDVKNALNKDERIYTCTYENELPSAINEIAIKKVKLPGETITKDCWKDVIESYPFQNPGVWLHPFINDLRFVFTTSNEKPYQYFLMNSKHPTSTNSNNYQVQGGGNNLNLIKIGKGTLDKTAKTITFKKANNNLNVNDIISFDKSGLKSYKIMKVDPNKKIFTLYNVDVENKDYEIYKFDFGISNTKKFYFREFFDIKNISIKEEFHIAIVINKKIVEVYIDGSLRTTQQLFGEPTYNYGKLHINPMEITNNGDNIKLGGVVRQFKYYPHSITYNNIISLIGDRKIKQNIGGDLEMITEDHEHSITFSHEHSFDEVDQGHEHSIHEDNIPKSYNSN
mgnify:CR=1 FL=1